VPTAARRAAKVQIDRRAQPGATEQRTSGHDRQLIVVRRERRALDPVLVRLDRIDVSRRHFSWHAPGTPPLGWRKSREERVGAREPIDDVQRPPGDDAKKADGGRVDHVSARGGGCVHPHFR